MPRREGQVARTLMRQCVAWDEAVADPRDARGRRHGHHGLLNLLVLGFACGMATLRRVEELSSDLSRKARRALGMLKQASDTTLYMLLASQGVNGLRATLQRQVKALLERKRVSNDAFPLGVISLDGKSIWTSDWKHVPGAKEQLLDNGATLSSFAMLSAVLTSSSVRPCLDLQLIPEKSGEAPASRDMVRRLVEVFGSLFSVFTGDAGLTCRETANLVRELGKHYVLSLKDNQPTLMKVAEEAFAASCSAHRVSQNERRNGAHVERTLSTLTVADVAEFTELRAQEVWQVLQESVEIATGRVTLEVRYFVSSLPATQLSPTDKLGLVRMHWGIENGLHWTLDARLKADDHQPCQLSARSLEVTCWLRALAYNILAARRGPKHEKSERPAWSRVMVKLRDLLVHETLEEPLAHLA
jgi:predicted transposase YbfD/YdcC